MDVFAVRSKNPQQGEALSHDAGTGAAVQGLIATFSDMLRSAGVRMGGDAASLMPKGKAEAITSRPDAEAAERSRDSRPERRDDATAAPAEKPRRARNGQDKARNDETKPADKSAVSEKADRAKTPASAASEADAPAKPTERADAEPPANPAAAPVEAAASGETATADPAAPQDEAAAIGQMVETATAPVDAPPPGPTDFVAGILAAQLFTPGATPGADPANAAADTISAVDDLSVAVIAAGQGKTAGDAGLAAAMAAPASAATSAAAAKTAAAPQQAAVSSANAATPQGEAPTAGDAAALNAADLKVQQAAALSRLTGNGNLIAVRTTVTEPSAHLVSQPAATLSAPIVAAAAEPTTSAAPATAPAQQAAPLNAAIQASLAGTEASPLAQQNQQAEAQMARSPGASVAADAAKTLVQAVGTTASTGMQTSSGGGEGLAGSGAHAALHTPATQHAQHTQAAQPRFTVAQQAAVDQVSVQISKAIKDGVDRINIQLRPENMGRVEVRLEVTDGRVAATVTADSKETLDMLQKDARELERALQQAGLQTDNGSLSFSLRGQQGQGQEGDRQVAGGRSGPETAAAEETAAETPAWTDYPGGIRPDGRIDIRA